MKSGAGASFVTFASYGASRPRWPSRRQIRAEHGNLRSFQIQTVPLGKRAPACLFAQARGSNFVYRRLIFTGLARCTGKAGAAALLQLARPGARPQRQSRSRNRARQLVGRFRRRACEQRLGPLATSCLASPARLGPRKLPAPALARWRPPTGPKSGRLDTESACWRRSFDCPPAGSADQTHRASRINSCLSVWKYWFSCEVQISRFPCANISHKEAGSGSGSNNSSARGARRRAAVWADWPRKLGESR